MIRACVTFGWKRTAQKRTTLARHASISAPAWTTAPLYRAERRVHHVHVAVGDVTDGDRRGLAARVHRRESPLGLGQGEFCELVGVCFHDAELGDAGSWSVSPRRAALRMASTVDSGGTGRS